MSIDAKRLMTWAALVFAYFVAFPGDFSAALGPIQEILALSTAASPWLFAVLAAAVVAQALVRCFGSKPTAP